MSCKNTSNNNTQGDKSYSEQSQYFDFDSLFSDDPSSNPVSPLEIPRNSSHTEPVFEYLQDINKAEMHLLQGYNYTMNPDIFGTTNDVNNNWHDLISVLPVSYLAQPNQNIASNYLHPITDPRQQTMSLSSILNEPTDVFGERELQPLVISESVTPSSLFEKYPFQTPISTSSQDVPPIPPVKKKRFSRKRRSDHDEGEPGEDNIIFLCSTPQVPTIVKHKEHALNQIVKEYFSCSSVERLDREYTFLLYFPKVILTSYAKERRFLHPPPTVTFFGGGWGLNPKAQFPTNQRTDSSFPVTVSATPLINDGSRNETMIGRTSVSAARLDGISSTTSVRDEVSRDIVGISRAPRIVAQSVFSKLHMNKGKYFSLRMQVHNSSDQEILQVESDVIKIISKPPRSNASDFNIKSGSTVALFNRLNAQTKTTKYLACSADGSMLISKSLNWDSFIIWKADDPRLDINKPAKASHIPYQAASSHGLFPYGKNEIDCLTLVTAADSLLETKPADLPCPLSHQAYEYSVLPSFEEIFSTTNVFGSNSNPTPPITPNLTVKEPIQYDLFSSDEEGDDEVEEPPIKTRQHPSSLPSFDERIYYNSDQVLFQNVTTGSTSKKFIIRDTSAIPIREGREMAISENHKLLLEMVDEPGAFLVTDVESNELSVCQMNEQLPSIVKKPKPARKNKNQPPKSSRKKCNNEEYEDDDYILENDSDSEIEGKTFTKKKPARDNGLDAFYWTIIGINKTEMTFYIPPNVMRSELVQTQTPPTLAQKKPKLSIARNPFLKSVLPLPVNIYPIPMVKEMNVNVSKKQVLLNGENLSEDYQIYFGIWNVEVVTRRLGKSILVKIPDQSASCLTDLPIILVRNDGLIFRTPFYYKKSS